MSEQTRTIKQTTTYRGTVLTFGAAVLAAEATFSDLLTPPTDRAGHLR